MQINTIDLLTPRHMTIKYRLPFIIGTLFLCMLYGFPLTAQNYPPQGTVKIMPLGNSITQGTTGQDRAPYRRYLWLKLQQNNFNNVDFIGSLNNVQNSAGPGFFNDYNRNHEGHWGWRASEILNGYQRDDQPNNTGSGKLSVWLQSHVPDLVMLHLGTNEMIQYNVEVDGSLEAFYANTIQTIREIITELRNTNPDVFIFLAQLIPAKRSDVNTRITTFNTHLFNLAKELDQPYPRVILVDQNNGFIAATDLYDNWHPNAVGAQKMADRWYEHIELYLDSNLPPYSGPRFVAQLANNYPMVIGDEFEISLSNVRNSTTVQSLNGPALVEIKSDYPSAGNMIFNGNVDFFQGNAIMPILINNAGSYNLSIKVSGVAYEEEIKNVHVNDYLVWKGLASSDWNNPTNWQQGIAPAGYPSFIIIEPENYQPAITTAVSANKIIVQRDAHLTISAAGILTIENNNQVVVRPGGSLTSNGLVQNHAAANGFIIESDKDATASVIINNSGVQATVQRFLSGMVFHIISPPVIGQSFQDFFENNSISKNVVYAMQQYYQEQGWSAYFSSDKNGVMEPGKAYSIRIGPRDGGVVVFKGVLLHESLPQEIKRTSSTNGWNGIGNPFTSSIGASQQASVTSFLEQNVNQLDASYAGLYLWDPRLYGEETGGYRILNNIEDEQKNYLSLGQGFIVKSRPEGGEVSFDVNKRSHTNPGFYKKQTIAPWYHLTLNAHDNNGNISSTRLVFNQAMSKGLDVTYDAGVYNPENNFLVYSRFAQGESDIKLAVQALPDAFENMIVPLGLLHNEKTEITFSVQSLNLPDETYVYLEDTYENILTDLTSQDYSFTVEQSTDLANRFLVHLQNQKTFPVHFMASMNTYGNVLAQVKGEKIVTGTMIPKGRSIVFKAIPEENAVFRYWIVNNENHTHLNQEIFILDNLDHPVTVVAVFDFISSIQAHLDAFKVFRSGDFIIVDNLFQKSVSASLYHLNGQKILSDHTRNTERLEYEISGIATGIYILQLVGEQEVHNIKILIK
jgi:lysophospholipase L1-like esterase